MSVGALDADKIETMIEAEAISGEHRGAEIGAAVWKVGIALPAVDRGVETPFQNEEKCKKGLARGIEEVHIQARGEVEVGPRAKIERIVYRGRTCNQRNPRVRQQRQRKYYKSKKRFTKRASLLKNP